MLVLSRKAGEKIVIGDNIILEVMRVKGSRITLGLVAPENVKILRAELEPNHFSTKKSCELPAKASCGLTSLEIQPVSCQSIGPADSRVVYPTDLANSTGLIQAC